MIICHSKVCHLAPLSAKSLLMGCFCFLVRVVPQELELLRRAEKSRWCRVNAGKSEMLLMGSTEPGSWQMFGGGSGTRAGSRASLLHRSCCGLAFHKL